MLNQYRPGTIKTLILAANEHSLFKFEKDTEEEKTCGPIALALRPPRCVLLLLRPPGIGERGPKYNSQCLGLGIEARDGL
jgi:hypothetical protein